MRRGSELTDSCDPAPGPPRLTVAGLTVSSGGHISHGSRTFFWDARVSGHFSLIYTVSGQNFSLVCLCRAVRRASHLCMRACVLSQGLVRAPPARVMWRTDASPARARSARENSTPVVPRGETSPHSTFRHRGRETSTWLSQLCSAVGTLSAPRAACLCVRVSPNSSPFIRSFPGRFQLSRLELGARARARAAAGRDGLVLLAQRGDSLRG